MYIKLTRETVTVHALGPADETLTVEIDGKVLRTYRQEKLTGSTINHLDVAADIAKTVGAQEHYGALLDRIRRCELTAEGCRVRSMPDKAGLMYEASRNQLAFWLESLGHKFVERDLRSCK